MHKEKTKLHKLLLGLNELKWSISIKGIIAGAFAGLLAVVYRFGIEYAGDLSIKIYHYLSINPILILFWIAILIVAGLLLAFVIKFEPMAIGSGIPQVEGILIYGLKMRSYFIVIARFIGGITGAIFGLSLGREGPSIQIGAAGSQIIASKLSKSKMEENYLVTGGAAAGLSAAFNAPVSGMMFALEEVHRSFSPLVLLAAITASLTADFVSKYFFGLKPVLLFSQIPQLPLNLYLWVIPVGLVAGLIGSAMNKSLLGFQTVIGKLPSYLRPILALFIALPFGIFLPQVLGGGQNLIKIAEQNEIAILGLLLLFVAKFIFTCTSFGSGIPGGIFMPILTVGALTGGVLGLVIQQAGFPSKYIPCVVIFAMAGALASSVKAPVTSILLTAEMTGSLVHLLPVAACCLIALLVSDVLKIQPIYEALLERFFEKHGKTLPVEERGELIELPVEFGSEISDCLISDIKWPQGSLVVGLHRGTKNLIPKGNTKIIPGDYLLILSSTDKYNEIRNKIQTLCYKN